jgi:hypothetical protein
MRARPLATAVVGASLLLGLTGCEKPTPGVTVSSGRHSQHVEATTYCRDGQSMKNNDCSTDKAESALIRVKSGAEVGIDVDSAIAEHGWRLVVVGTSDVSPVQDARHFSFNAVFNQGPILDLQVQSLERVAEDATATGFWRIRLVQD